MGNGDGTLRAPVQYDSGGYAAAPVAVGDVNQDGGVDVVVANGCAGIPPCTSGFGVDGTV